MREILERLTAEHRQLLTQAEAIGSALSAHHAFENTPAARRRVHHLLQPFIERLKGHAESELKELFPVLRDRLPHADEWQVRMLEIQDEALLALAHDLLDWSANHSTLPVTQVQEKAARLIRWMEEHVTIEEERLFPRLSSGA